MGNKNPLYFLWEINLKKVIVLFVTIFAFVSNVQAQWTSLPDDDLAKIPAEVSDYEGKTFVLQGNPQSVVNQASYRFSTGIDNYLDVIAWKGVDYENFFLFLGGVAETKSTDIGGIDISSGIQGGLAARIGTGHLGVYFNGVIADGAYTHTLLTNDKRSRARWNDQLAVMYANPWLGGLRLDILFADAIFKMQDNDGGKIEASENHLTTSLQWGKSFGRFTPRITFGVQWPSYYKSSSGEEEWNSGGLGFLVELGIGNFGIDYQLSVDLGWSSKPRNAKLSGYVDNNLNAYYDFTGYINTALTLKIRPTLFLGFFFAENRYEEDGKLIVTEPNMSYIGIPEVGLQAGTKVDLGFQYAVNSKISIYSGLTARIIDFRPSIKLPSIDPDEETDIEIQLAVRGINVSGGNFAFLFNPSKNFHIELGLNNLVSFKSDNKSWGWGLNLLQPSGSLAISFSW